MKKYTPWWVIILLIISFSVTTCRPAEPTSISVGFDYYEMDSLFNGRYLALGGEEVLGPAISPKFNLQGLDYQYTASALFVYNPTLPLGQQIKLAPIGSEMGITEYTLPVENPAKGIEIYPGFLEFYQSLGGGGIVGSPITKVQYNSERGRLEQHFENLGFYQLDSNPEIRLLHYGAWMCANLCDFSTPINSEVVLFRTAVQPFVDQINTLDPEFIGRPLANPHIASDGKIEQIFQNVVLYTSNDNLAEIRFRPIPSILGIPSERGIDHAIPDHFTAYLEKHKGLNYVGSAITPYARQSVEVFRQCFENLCLDFFPNKSDSEQIKPSPLGYLYRDRYYREADFIILDTPSSEQTYSLKVWEENPLIPPNSPQSIGVSIQKDDQPINNIEAALILKLPERINIRYVMPPSQEDGRTSLVLNPIDAPHGTVIAYDVCIYPEDEAQTCVSESFLIWGNP